MYFTALLSIFYVGCLGLFGFYLSVMVEIMLAEHRTVKTRWTLNLHGNSSLFLLQTSGENVQKPAHRAEHL